MIRKRKARVLAALCLACLCAAVPAASAAGTFTDVEEGHWASDAIAYVAAQGYFKGTSDTQFSPDSFMTRAMFVTVISRVARADLDAAEKETPFSDVPPDAYYADAVSWAYDSGLITGATPTQFAPGEYVTRQQMLAVLYRFAERKGYDLSQVESIDFYCDSGYVAPYADSAVKWGLYHHMLHQNYSVFLDVFVNASRADMAYTLQAFDAHVVPHDEPAAAASLSCAITRRSIRRR